MHACKSHHACFSSKFLSFAISYGSFFVCHGMLKNLDHNTFPVLSNNAFMWLADLRILTNLILVMPLGVVYVGICSKEENVARDEAAKLISDGLEHKLVSVLQDLLSSSHPEQMVYLIKSWCLLSCACYDCNAVCFSLFHDNMASSTYSHGGCCFILHILLNFKYYVMRLAT